MKRMNNKAEPLRREAASPEILWSKKKKKRGSKDKGDGKDNVNWQLCQKK